MERVACFGAKGRLPRSAVLLRPSSAAPSAEDLLRRVDSTATEDGEEGSSLARRRSRVSVSTGAAVLDRGAAKPQPNGVRPSSGAETSDGYSCGSNPEPQTWLRLLRPGTAALRKLIAAYEQFPRLQCSRFGMLQLVGNFGVRIIRQRFCARGR